MNRLFQLFLISLFILPLSVSSQIQYRWGKALGHAQREEITALCFDPDGNLLLSAAFSDSLDIADGSDIDFIGGGGYRDALIAKIDPQGNFIWAHGFGNAAWDRPWSITSDAQANVYSGGVFSNRVDFDPGPDSAILVSNTKGVWPDGFISKYDPDGNFIWAKHLLTARALGASQSATLLAITAMEVDPAQSLIIGGAFWDTVYFDSSLPTVSVTSLRDMFLAKYDSNGNFIWAKQMGAAMDQQIQDLALDNHGNIYCTGYYFGSPDFDPGSGTSLLTSVGSGDIFLAKYDPNGELLWVHGFGSADNIVITPEEGRGIGVDSLGNVYFTGRFYGDIDFDPGPGTASLNLMGITDAFVAKYDTDGVFQWTFSVASPNYEVGKDLCVLADGRFYLGGEFNGTLDLDPGQDSTFVSSPTGVGIFAAQYDSQGGFIEGLRLRSLQTSQLASVAANKEGVAVGGLFFGTLLMGTGSQPDLRFSAGNADLFLASYGSESTGLFDRFSLPSFKVYPNPAQDLVSIEGQLASLQSPLLEITNLQGQVIHHQPLAKTNLIYTQISLAAFPAGIYYVHLHLEEGHSITKIVKQ